MDYFKFDEVAEAARFYLKSGFSSELTRSRLLGLYPGRAAKINWVLSAARQEWSEGSWIISPNGHVYDLQGAEHGVLRPDRYYILGFSSKEECSQWYSTSGAGQRGEIPALERGCIMVRDYGGELGARCSEGNSNWFSHLQKLCWMLAENNSLYMKVPLCVFFWRVGADKDDDSSSGYNVASVNDFLLEKRKPKLSPFNSSGASQAEDTGVHYDENGQGLLFE